MLRVTTLVGLFLLFVTTPIALVPWQNDLAAQAPKARALGPAAARTQRNFQRRVEAAQKTCDPVEYRALRMELHNAQTIQRQSEKLQEQRLAKVKSGEITDTDEVTEIRARYKDANDSSILLLFLKHNLETSCDPVYISYYIIDYKDKCKEAEANKLLQFLEELVGKYKRQLESAKLAGALSKISVKDAQNELQQAEQALDRAKRHPLAKCKPKNRVGAIDSGGETVTSPGIFEPAPDLPDVIVERDFDADRLFEISENTSWLLGDWIYNAWDGGQTNSVLRFRMESDGTISGYLISVTNEMAQKGYQPGMQLLQGIRDTSHTIRKPGNTWSHSAMGGQTFSPKDPKREPGQIYGQDEWFDSGVLFVGVGTNELGGSTGFQTNRLNWHRGTLSRPNLSSLQQAVRELSEVVERLDQAGSDFERMEALPGIIERLEQSGQYSREAREAASIMRLLLDRENLINDPAFRRAMTMLEDGEIEIEELNDIAANIVARGALLGQTIPNNAYNDDMAANMFLIGLNGARIHNRMADGSGTEGESSQAQLADALSTIQRIAATSGEPRQERARPLMEGLRDLSLLPRGRPGTLSVLELPAQTASALLEQTAAGFRHGASALKELENAILRDDRSAFARSSPHIRRLEHVVSGPGYLEAVTRSVTDRVVRHVPFVKTVVNWFD